MISQHATKVDQNISQATRMFFRYAYNKRTETRYTNGLTSGPAQDGQLPLWRINHTGVADWVRVAGSTLVFNVRAGLNQYLELARSDPGLGFNSSELGLTRSSISLSNEGSRGGILHPKMGGLQRQR